MRTCSPSEFVSRWPGALRPISLPKPAPAFPDECQHLLVEWGLPRALNIYCHNDITFTFSGYATALAAIWERDLKMGCCLGDMPGEWTRFWHVADQAYTQGGGWVCLEEGSGRLVVIDLDLNDPIYLINSSVANFYTTLAYFLDWSATSDGGRKQAAFLRDTLLQQNCIAVRELEPFWMNFVEASLDSEPVHVGVVVSGWREARGRSIEGPPTDREIP